MFEFIVRYFGFLKHLPLLPHFYESMLRICTVCFRPDVADCMDRLEREVLKWPHVSIGIHKYGGIQFNLHGKEFGHIHGNGLLDILFNRSLKNELIRTGTASDHHIFRKSGWVSFYVRQRGDETEAIALLERKYKMAVEEHGFMR